jgi:mono-ADP-ribosyltransferase sirtuin 6
MNTIINFSEYLETDIQENAEEHAERSDLFLSLGTTLRVTPACDLVEMGKQPIRLIVCNR